MLYPLMSVVNKMEIILNCKYFMTRFFFVRFIELLGGTDDRCFRKYGDFRLNKFSL